MQLGKMQVDAELMYHNRSSVITVVLGMLAVAFVGLVTKGGKVNLTAGVAVAIGGLIISVLWLLMEQRNQVYFVARGNVIGEIETRVIALYGERGFDFPVFWGRVPGDVRSIAKPYQRVSAPLISRGLIPSMFCVLWLIFVIQGVILRSEEANGSPPPPTSVPVSVGLDMGASGKASTVTKEQTYAKSTPSQRENSGSLGFAGNRGTSIQLGPVGQVDAPNRAASRPAPAQAASATGTISDMGHDRK